MLNQKSNNGLSTKESIAIEMLGTVTSYARHTYIQLVHLLINTTLMVKAIVQSHEVETVAFI